MIDRQFIDEQNEKEKAVKVFSKNDGMNDAHPTTSRRF